MHADIVVLCLNVLLIMCEASHSYSCSSLFLMPELSFHIEVPTESVNPEPNKTASSSSLHLGFIDFLLTYY